MAPPDLNENIESIKNDLFEKAMKGKWSEVADIYREKAKAHKAIITKSGDTALHIAVSDGQEEIVNALVDILISNGPSEGKEALAIENELGNTPLHVAASMGNVSMCQCIAQVDPSLVGARNKDSETPFFLAALHGQKQAFLCLLRICGPGACDDYSRRADGDTILHVAIAGDYFDLAFQIIHLFEDLVNSVNQQGFSPLHLLAGKPSAFKSGSSFGRCYNIIYHCIYVEELKVEVCDAQPLPITNPDDAKDPNYPKNYRTCVNFLRLFRNAVSVVFRKGKNGDLERQTAGQSGERVLEKQAQGGKNADLERQKEGHSGSQATNGAQSRQLFPDNYVCCHQFVKLAYKALLVVLGLGSAQIKKIHDKKQKHTWSRQIMNELLERASTNQYGNTGTKPLLGSTLMQADQGVTPPYSIDHPESSDFPEMEKQKSSTPDSLEANQKDKNEESDGKDMKGEGMNKPFGMAKNETTILITAKNGVTKIVERIQELFPVAIQDANAEKNVMLLTVQNKEPHESFIGMGKNPEMEKRETPILIAAKNGITEIVEKILELSPVAIHDRNAEKKNIVLLAVENRQPHVYQLLLDRKILRDSVFRVVDNEGNSALHLAAKLGEYKPWLIPGAALQMQWEIKWYEFVKESTTSHFFPRYNREGKTPKEIFTETHKNLVEKGGEWLNKTSESCSVVAALIATVAFATSATVPGGVKQDIGTPTLENQPAFDVFAISSLGALCFSVTSMVMFLSILTSRYQERDFGRDLPTKLLVGLTSLFVSIASMLISFCAGHFFVLKDKLKYAAFPVYAVTCLPVTFFAMVQFPLYFDLIWATFKKVPQRSYKTMPL